MFFDPQMRFWGNESDNVHNFEDFKSRRSVICRMICSLMHFVDLGKSFQMSLWSLKPASVLPTVLFRLLNSSYFQSQVLAFRTSAIFLWNIFGVRFTSSLSFPSLFTVSRETPKNRYREQPLPPDYDEKWKSRNQSRVSS